MKRNSLLFIILLALLTSCGIYSFSGTSIQPDVKTVTVNYFGYTALQVNPSLANDLTEAVKEKFRRLTRLEQVESDGDLELTAEVSGYDVRASSISAEEVAAQNRLTVTVKLNFMNRKHTEDAFEKNFSAYADFDATQSLDSAEGALCEEIIEKIVEDIFNATVANW